MRYPEFVRSTAAVTMALLFLTINCPAQNAPLEETQDHSCTVNIAGGPVLPSGDDGDNFNPGWTLQAGGGFAVTPPPEASRGAQWFVTANYMFAKLGATNAALTIAQNLDKAQLSTATAAHGAFSAVTIDPTLRYSLNRRLSVYGSGGFGWFRRGIGFNGANPANLLHASASSLDRLASNSGVFDLGVGVNYGLPSRGGLMLYGEMRVYKGAAVNSSTTLLPLSFGIRW